MKKILLFIPLLIFALEPRLVEMQDMVNDPRAISSSDGSYIGLFEYGKGNTEFVPISHFVLEDKNGNSLYEKQVFGHTLLDIANTGIVVGIDFDGPVSGKGILHFYDQHGKKINSYTIDFLLERVFSKNGEVYCVNDGNNGLIIFNRNGEKIYDLEKANFFSVSHDGSMIAAARDAGIDVYENGQFIRHIPSNSPFVRQMVFSNDGSRLLYMNKKQINCTAIKTGELIFHYQETNEHLSFTSCDISPDRSLIIAGLDRDAGKNTPDRHTHGSVYMFNDQGDIIWSKDIAYNRWNTSIPRVFFTEASSFAVETIDNKLVYNY